MSLGPRTAVGRGINWTGAVPKAGYPKGSGGVAPPSHVVCFQGRVPYAAFPC